MMIISSSIVINTHIVYGQANQTISVNADLLNIHPVPWLQSTCGRCEWCQRGKLFFCQNQVTTGINIAGSHAEYMVAYADATQLLPDGLSYDQAAPIFCAGYTVYSGLRFAYPKPHERVAVVGIGALGHLGIQYSNAAGFETIAVTHS